MESVTAAGGAFYRHIKRPKRAGPLACPECGRGEAEFHSHRTRSVEHLGAEQPCYLVLTQAKYACPHPECPRKYFSPPVAEAAPRARTSQLLQGRAKELYRDGRDSLRGVERGLRRYWHTGTGKSSVLRWHQEGLRGDYPGPEHLEFSGVLCIDEVYDQVDGKRQPIFTCVDPIAGITVRVPVERADGESLASAMEQLRALGAEPKVIVSDLWAAYPEALRRVWPRAERQICWFHVMQWVTAKLSALIREYGQTLPEEQRKRLNRLRFRLLASPEKQARFGKRARAELSEAWDLIAGTVVAEAIGLRNDLRSALNESTTKMEARRHFDKLRSSWPERFRPWSWRPGEPIPEPKAGEAEGAEGLKVYLEEIMAFFVRYFEMMITYLGHPGVPRTNNHSERENRRYRSVARVRYGWGSLSGLKGFLITLQGFDPG
jgi:transposase